MLGGELGGDQQRGAEGGDLDEALAPGPEGEGEGHAAGDGRIAIRSGSRPATWPQMLKGESRPAW